MKIRLVFALVTFFAIGLHFSLADYTDWIGGSPGDWTDEANWNNGLPGAGKTARVRNGGIAEISNDTVFSDYIQAGVAGYGSIRVSSGGVITNSTITVGYTGIGGKMEIFGGDILCSNKSFYVGNSSGTTGTVEMTGGTLDVNNFIIGNSGIGNFTLNEGYVSTRYWQSFVGFHSGCLGTFTQNGGTNEYLAGSCFLAYDKGSTGRYILNGGTLRAPSISIGNYGDGYMELNGGTLDISGNIYLGVASSSTGTLVANNYTNTFNSLILGRSWTSQRYSGGTNIFIMNGGDITINSLQIAPEPDCVSTFVQNGGKLTLNGSLKIPYDEDPSSGTVIISNNAVANIQGVTIEKDGRFEIHDSDVSMDGSFYMNSTDSYAELDGGSLTSAGTFYVPSGTNSATFHLKNGYFRRTYVANQSYQFYIGGKSANSGPGTFIQTGGVLENDEGLYLGRYSTNYPGRYIISGGTIDSPDRDLNVSTGVGAFRLIGSAPSVLFRCINSAGNDNFLLEFVLDKSPEHLAPIHFNWDRGYCCGHLRVGLDGGVVLSSTNAFTILQWDDTSASSAYYYNSTPDPNMWSTSFKSSSPANSRITLADGYKQGDLDMKGTKELSFDAMPMGHVTLSNLRTNRLISLVVSMDINEVDKSVDEIVADMVEAGYTNSVVKDRPPYDLQLHIPASDVVDKSVEDLSYFIWDFTDPTTLATNATVNAVSFELIRSPSQGSVIIIE